MTIERVITEWMSRKDMTADELVADQNRRYPERTHIVTDSRTTKTGRTSYLVTATLRTETTP